MKKDDSIQPGQEPAGIRQRLTELREAMLPLHKALLEFDRVGYEATFGKIQSPFQFLKLVMEDPWFTWLTPMTQLITAMDEWCHLVRIVCLRFHRQYWHSRPCRLLCPPVILFANRCSGFYSMFR